MAELIQKIQDMLKEETWTRATISNYTQNNLKELYGLMTIIDDNMLQALLVKHLSQLLTQVF